MNRVALVGARAGGGDRPGVAPGGSARTTTSTTATSPPPARRSAGGFRATPEWQPLQDWGRKASHERIGVVGRASAFGQYFFYGTDLTNHVQYIGTQLNHGTYRPINSCAKWREAVNDGHYEYIVTTPLIGQDEIRRRPTTSGWRGTRT